MTNSTARDDAGMQGRRVLVCGGRAFEDYAFLRDVLDYYAPTLVIHGAARGADSLAHRWAQNRCISVESHPADWQAHGKAAGPIRNAKMISAGKPDLVIAFPGGKGTANMVKIATDKGVPVIQPRRGAFVFMPLFTERPA